MMLRQALDTTRVFYATDIHGSTLCFRKFLNASHYYKANTLILGGDLTGKAVIPIIEQTNAAYSAEFLGQERILKDQRELDCLENEIANSGMYSFRTDKEQIADLNAHPAKMDQLFKELINRRLREWMGIVDELRKTSEVMMYVTGGNDDDYSIDQILEEPSAPVVHATDEIVYLDDLHEMISLPYSNMTPWKCPRDISEDEYGKRIEGIADKVRDHQNAIFNFHCPPIDSGLDTCPRLDATTYPPKPIVENGTVVVGGAGSTAVRSAIEKNHPLVGLHGHIHESRGLAKIGGTMCFNPGSEYSEGILRGVILSLNDKKVGSYLFTSG